MTTRIHDARTEPHAPAAARRGRHTALVAAAVALVGAVAGTGALGLGGGGDERPRTPPRSGSLVPVTRATLTERTTVEGQLGYGAEVPLPVKATGTVTWLPAQGTAVGRGGTLLRVDDRPVVLLYGSLPMYRELGLVRTRPETEGAGAAGDETEEAEAAGKAPGEEAGGTGAADEGVAAGGAGAESAGKAGAESAGKAGAESAGGTKTPVPATTAPAPPPQPLRGRDVLQFERNLAALGYGGFTVDDTFTDATARAVRRWQEALGVPQTGTVAVGDVVYAAGRVRIGHAGVRLGSPAGENALSCTDTTRKVVVDASAADARWAVPGTRVRVGLPDGRWVAGEVTAVGRQARPAEGDGGGDGDAGDGGGAGATVPVTVSVRDQQALGRLESGPVSVEYVGREARDVLAVPVSALVALAEGGYGLETADGRFLPVRTGLFADGRVEVAGPAVRPGVKVRIPE
ncbi:peptidoglycan-binding protein [Streptomyces griseosporeus]|uniref:peptidoglycan-binding protein n=1 Tax=Streptomyces griseosporeus TaxID=1910 RepID=UPI0036FE5700